MDYVDHGREDIIRITDILSSYYSEEEVARWGYTIAYQVEEFKGFSLSNGNNCNLISAESFPKPSGPKNPDARVYYTPHGFRKQTLKKRRR